MNPSLDSLVVVWGLMCYCTVGWVFLHMVFFNQLRSWLVQALFAATFAVSVSMLMLVIFEILNVLEVTTRWWCWKSHLGFMVLDLVVLTPFCLFRGLLHDVGVQGWKGSVAALPALLLYIWGFLHIKPHTGVAVAEREPTVRVESLRLGEALGVESRVGEAVAGAVDGAATNLINSPILAECLSRVGVIGVAVMALLSGFGAVATPRAYLAAFRARTAPAVDSAVLDAQQRLRLMAAELARKRRDELALLDALAGQGGARGGLAGYAVGFASFVKRRIGGSDPREALSMVRVEIAALERVVSDIFQQLHDLRTLEEEVSFSRTPRGMVFTALGYVLSLYCIYKTVMTSVCLALNRVAQVDPITRGLQLGTDWLGLSVDVYRWTSQLSLLFIGIMIVSSVRGFLVVVQRIVQAYFSGVSPNSICLLFGYLMGTYFTSTVMLLRMSLPAQYRQMLTEVLGESLQFNFFHQWFDVIFLCSVLLSGLVLWMFDRARAERLRDAATQ